MQSSKVFASMIDNSNGKMVTVSFIKQDGSLRTINGRIGVRKYIKGSSVTNKNDQYITFYDVKNKGYRSINRDTITGIRYQGIEAVAVK